MAVFIFALQYKLSLLSLVPNLRIISQVATEESLTEKCPYVLFKERQKGKNEKLKKEGKIKISIFIFIYTIHYAYLKVYTNFENTGSNRS